MKKWIVGIICIFIHSFALFPQAYFQSSYFVTGSEGFTSVCKINENEVLILGGKDFVSSSGNMEPGLYNKMLITKMDRNGNVLDMHELTFWWPVIPYTIKNTLDGGYIVVGAIKKTANPNGLIVKLNAALQIEWIRSYYFGTITNIAENDHCYVTSGWLQPGINDQDWIAMKLDKNGNIIWSNSYTTGPNGINNPYDRAHDVVLEPNGNITMIGDFFDQTAILDYNFNSLVVHMDSLGNIIWQNKLWGKGYGKSIYLGSDNNYYCSCLYANYRVSSSGTTQWIKEFSASPGGLDYFWVYKMIPAINPFEFVFVGKKNDASSNSYVRIMDDQTFSGNSKEFVFGVESEVFDAVVFNDGKILSVGTSYYADSTKANTMFTDNNVSISASCPIGTMEDLYSISFTGGSSPMTRASYAGFYVAEASYTYVPITGAARQTFCFNDIGIETYNDQLHIYPNPIVDHLNIDLDENIPNTSSIQLINSFGEVVIEKQLLQKNNQIIVNHLPSGMYILQCILNGQSFCKRIIKI